MGRPRFGFAVHDGSERIAALALLLAIPAAVACAPQASSQRPDVLLVVVDTLRADHTSAYGYARDTTPNMDRVADAGVRFTTAYAPTATTGPTHAVLFTSLDPYRTGILKNGLVLHDQHRTLAERLADEGYQTAAIVSSFVLHRKFGFAQGFAEYADDFPVEGATLRTDHFEGGEVEKGFDRRAAVTTERAGSWLREVRDEALPFFLFLHYFDPHDPYDPPAAYRQRFAASDPEPTRLARASSLYDAEIAYTDAEIGRLLGILDELELGRNTLIVLTADHGEGLWGHGHLFHDVHLYEEAVRVPLIVRWPALLEAGREISEPVSLIDLAPTILDLVGVELPNDLGGRSLGPALRGDARLQVEHPVFLVRRRFAASRVGSIPVRGEQNAVRSGNWKYIEAPELKSRELFDLARDPNERRNLVDDETERADQLARRLAEWRSGQAEAHTPAPVVGEDAARLEALGYVE